MKRFGNILWGIILIGIGAIFGLNALNIVEFDIFFDGWWTLLIIIPCFRALFTEREKVGNLIGICIGVTLLLWRRNVLEIDMVWKLILPAALVIIGMSIIFRDRINNKITKEINNLNKNSKDANAFSAIFAGQDLKFDNEDFDGATLSAVFGEVKCDLRKAIITKDVVINASTTFGGIEIYVPNNVQIKIKSNPIFGGLSDKTSQNIQEDSHIIYINAVSTFGGVDIKN